MRELLTTPRHDMIQWYKWYNTIWNYDLPTKQWQVEIHTTRGPLLQQRIHLYLNVHISVASTSTNGSKCVAFFGVARVQCNTYRSVGNLCINRCKITTEFEQQFYALVDNIGWLNVLFQNKYYFMDRTVLYFKAREY